VQLNESAPLFYRSWAEAARAAEAHGLILDDDGRVRVISGGGKLNGLSGGHTSYKKRTAKHRARFMGGNAPVEVGKTCERCENRPATHSFQMFYDDDAVGRPQAMRIHLCEPCSVAIKHPTQKIG
jgi:hypothetical protein